MFVRVAVRRVKAATIDKLCALPNPAGQILRRRISSSGEHGANKDEFKWGAGVRSFQLVDTHCEGEPARILVGGMPTVPGNTMFQKRNYIMENLDQVRTLLITEPRGYPCQNLDIVVPSTDECAHYGFVIAEQVCCQHCL